MSDKAFSNVNSDADVPDYILDNEEVEESDEVRSTWEDSYLYSKYKKRRGQERDLVILIIGENASTGTGKTTLAVQLADKMDQSSDGFTEEKATPYIDEFFKLYKDVEEGSAIVGDEAQGLADSRKSMTNENVYVSQIMSRARFREVYTILTMPKQEAKETARELYQDECSTYDEVRNHPDMPESPHGKTDNWSKAYIVEWLSDSE